MKTDYHSCLFAFVLSAAVVSGQVIATGNTFSVASSSDSVLTGTHYHNGSSPDSYFPAGRAEVGRYGPEEVRALSEFDLASVTQPASDPVFLTFNVFFAGGQFQPGPPNYFLGFNDYPFRGTIAAYAYAGNNAEDITDYQITPRVLVGTFSTWNFSAGDTISIEITSPLQSALLDHVSSLGFRLQEQPLLPPDSGAWTFSDFRMTLQDQTSHAIPEPSASGLWGAILLGAAVAWRCLRTQNAAR